MIKQLYTLLLAICMIALTNCERDGEMLMVSMPQDTNSFSVDITKSVLSKAAEKELAMTVIFGNITPEVSNPNVALPNDMVDVKLQFSLDELFEKHIEENIEAGSQAKQYTVGALNEIMTKLEASETKAYDVYLRTSMLMGENMEATYSQVVKVAITPFTVDMSVMKLVDKNDHTIIIAEIKSSNSNTRFEGFVNTSSAWYNFYFMAGDGTLWGNETVTWVPFALSSNEPGNCWFGNTQGDHYVIMDTEKLEWSTIHTPQLNVTVGTNTATMSKKDGKWTHTFQTATANEAISISGDGMEYNKTTGDAAPVAHSFTLVLNSDNGFAFVSGTQASTLTAPKAGTTYTLTLDPQTQIWTLEEGGDIGETYPENLFVYYYQKDGSTKLDFASKLTSKTGESGQYQGFISTDATWANTSLVNFRFHTSNDDTAEVYGSTEAGQYLLATNGWNSWPTTGGLNYVSVNLVDKTWSEVPQQIAIVGSFNNWSLTSDKMTFDTTTARWIATCNVSTIGDGLKIVIGATENDWTYQYADADGDLTLSLTTGNDNIKPAETGTYKIELALNDFNAPTYTITKL